jgi:para-nitrobenzyl esterase
MGSEDCLYLNVWSPAADGAARPVLVWVHGGGFIAGYSHEYDGAALAARGDAVVVTVNYRLGPWGLLHLTNLNGYADSANPAIRDLVAALTWVRENIAGFGGDPGTVTVFGQSAGAMLIGTLLGTPAARALFSRAVLLSGGAEHVRDPAEAGEVVRRLLAELDLSAADAHALGDLPTVTLAIAADKVRLASGDAELGGHPYLPVIDGDVLSDHPLREVARGAARDVSIVVSWCRDEMAGFDDTSVLRTGLEPYVRRIIGEAEWARLETTYLERDALLADLVFGQPAIRLAEAQHAGGGRAWLMRYDHTPGIGDFPALGPAHGADIPLLWSGVGMFLPSPASPGIPPTPMGKEDAAVAAALQDSLLALARTGVPSSTWPRYDPDRRATLLMRAPPAVVDDPDSERRRAWQGVPMPASQNPPA